MAIQCDSTTFYKSRESHNDLRNVTSTSPLSEDRSSSKSAKCHRKMGDVYIGLMQAFERKDPQLKGERKVRFELLFDNMCHSEQWILDTERYLCKACQFYHFYSLETLQPYFLAADFKDPRVSRGLVTFSRPSNAFKTVAHQADAENCLRNDGGGKLKLKCVCVGVSIKICVYIFIYTPDCILIYGSL